MDRTGSGVGSCYGQQNGCIIGDRDWNNPLNGRVLVEILVG
jgi:hypothetical protein